MKKAKYITLISALLIFGLLSLILFLTIPADRLASPLFWTAFSIAIPFNLLCFALFTLWGFAKSDAGLIRLPIAFNVSVVFALVYLVSGALFMYLPAEDFTFPVILYAVITVVYIIAAMISINGAGYMVSVEKEVKEKRLFVRILEADVNDCLCKAAHPDSRKLLKQLADDVRYSDPMSHASLAGVESDLSAAVYAISSALTENPEADITSSVTKASALLQSRNSRCLMLK